MLPCPNCNEPVNARKSTICFNCGWDLNNPIDFHYNESDKHNIRNNVKGVDWLQNVEIDTFISEKKSREYILKVAQSNVESRQKDPFIIEFLQIPKYKEIMDYCLKHYSSYDDSLIYLRSTTVEKELKYIFPFLGTGLSEMVCFALLVALNTIAQNQVDEIYEAMQLRKDKGIKGKTDDMLEHATAEPQEIKQESDSLMDDLERLGNMYKKGLLTEEEFTLAKKKLLEGE